MIFENYIERSESKNRNHKIYSLIFGYLLKIAKNENSEGEINIPTFFTKNSGSIKRLFALGLDPIDHLFMCNEFDAAQNLISIVKRDCSPLLQPFFEKSYAKNFLLKLSENDAFFNCVNSDTVPRLNYSELAIALKTNTKIKKLCFLSRYVCDHDCFKLIEIIESCHSATELILSQEILNKIADSHPHRTKFLGALDRNTSLLSLTVTSPLNILKNGLNTLMQNYIERNRLLIALRCQFDALKTMYVTLCLGSEQFDSMMNLLCEDLIQYMTRLMISRTHPDLAFWKSCTPNSYRFFIAHKILINYATPISEIEFNTKAVTLSFTCTSLASQSFIALLERVDAITTELEIEPNIYSMPSVTISSRENICQFFQAAGITTTEIDSILKHYRLNELDCAGNFSLQRI